MVALTLILLACRPGTSSKGPEPAPGETADSAGHADSPRAPDSADSASDSAADSGTPVESVPGHIPGQDLFADDVVHALSLTLDATAWASLLAAPDAYVDATFSDGRVELAVGVRLKGYSSWQPITGKPNLRVRFDHRVEGQTYDGLEAVDLINEAEDPARLSEALAYRIFRAAGQPASRTGFASLTLNEAPYGLYTLVEKKDDQLIDRWWPEDDEGSLYESSSEMWPCDLDDGGTPRCDCWDQDEVGSADSRADLEALCAVATDTADGAWYPAIQAAVDWTEVSRHMAMEMVLDAHDHYAGYMGNVYLYHSPEAAGWSLIPASMNSAYGSSRYVAGSCGSSGRTLASFDGGLLARRCWDDADCTADLQDAVRDMASALAASDALAQLDAWEAMLEPYVEVEPKLSYTVEDFHTHVGCIREWLGARPAALARELPATCLGEGGDLDVTGWGDLSSNGSCDRESPDIVGFRVAGLDGARLELEASPDGLAAGDAVMLLWAQGAEVELGAYELAEVAGVDATGITLDVAPSLAGDPGDGALLVQRVPTYDTITVRAGGVLTAGAWDGQTGGLLALRVGELVVEAGGQVSADGLGYAGGPMGASYNTDGYQGESWTGAGAGGASSGAGYNESNGAWAANAGGGGCNVGGGGGEHAGGATGSTSWNGTSHAPEPGETYGAADLSALTFGSGGGGVVNLGGSSGPGGAGGGVLYIEATSITVEGSAGLVARGADATSWASGSWTYGAGGGAGGSVLILADELSLASEAIQATGGAGYDSGVTRPGGTGGEGRVRIDCTTVNGSPCTAAALSGLSTPEPWTE